MKTAKLKGLCAVCAAVLTLGICPVGTASASATLNRFRSMGDADGDGIVSVEDAQNVLVSYVKAMSKSETIDAVEDPASDTNMDGVIDIIDATNILKYYCKTLSGGKPMWAEFRNVNEITGCKQYSDDYDEIVKEDGTVIHIYNPQKVHTGPAIFRGYEKKGMFLEIGVAAGKPGDYVAIPVFLSGVPVLAGCQMYLNEAGGAELVGIRSFIGREYVTIDSIPNAVVNPDPQWGALAWVAPGGRNVSIEDGSIIAEYIYHIPEDAVPGTTYTLSVDKNDTRFVSDGSEVPHDRFCDPLYYQFTLLDGAIRVQ